MPRGNTLLVMVKFIPSGTGRSNLTLSKFSSEAHQLHRASKHSHQLTAILWRILFLPELHSHELSWYLHVQCLPLCQWPCPESACWTPHSGHQGRNACRYSQKSQGIADSTWPKQLQHLQHRFQQWRKYAENPLLYHWPHHTAVANSDLPSTEPAINIRLWRSQQWIMNIDTCTSGSQTFPLKKSLTPCRLHQNSCLQLK